MTEAFCLAEQKNVIAIPGRRCINDLSLVIPPSTLCAHRSWLADGSGWSDCSLQNPCKPYAADAWKSILGQQAAAVKRNADRNRAAKQFSAQTPKPPKLATTRKTSRPQARAPRPGRTARGYTLRVERQCAHCREFFKPPRQTSRFCSQPCSQADRASTQITPSGSRWLQPIPCPVCATPFKPASMGANKPRRQTCSVACGRVQSARTQTIHPRHACPTCGAPVAPKSIGREGRRRRFCSLTCYQQSDSRQRTTRGRWAVAS